MQKQSRTLGLTLCLTAAIALTGLTACRTSSDRSVGRRMDDRQVNRRVKGALASSSMYKFPDVRANTFDGVVQLSGFVDSQAQRTEAASLVQNVQGVHEVVNSLVLKPSETVVLTPAEPAPAPAPSPTGSSTGQKYGQHYYDSEGNRVMIVPAPAPNQGTTPGQGTTPTQPNPGIQKNPNANQP